MDENKNNIPETEKTNNIINEPKNYLDFIVEDDVFEIPQKRFSVTKLLSSIFAIIAGLILLYTTVELFISTKSQIQYYMDMGVPFTFGTLFLEYLPIVFISMMSLCPVVGALLPKKYSKCTAFLCAIPVSYLFVVSIQQTIVAIISKLPFSEAFIYYAFSLSGVLTLASAILALTIKNNEFLYEDIEEYEPWSYEDDENDFLNDEEAEEFENTDAAVNEIENEATIEEADFAEPAEKEE